MGKADGAKVWTNVLSELANVEVTVQYERPAWRVYWRDGPTRQTLMTRALALSRYRVGAPLPAEELRFIRSNSVTAIALAWLVHGSPRSPSGEETAVQAWCEDTGYPKTRFDEADLAEADLLVRLGRGDAAEMGALLAQAAPPVRPHIMNLAGPNLTGRVTSYSWPTGGPPDELLGPQTPAAVAAEIPEPPPTCQRCGKPLPTARHRGRPAKFCGTACRVAAHRAAHGADAA